MRIHLTNVGNKKTITVVFSVKFRRPLPLRGAVIQPGAPEDVGSVVLWWEESGNGWVTANNTLVLRDTDAAQVASYSINSKV